MKLTVDEIRCEKSVEKANSGNYQNLTSSRSSYHKDGCQLASNSLFDFLIEFWSGVLQAVAYSIVAGILYAFRRQIRTQYRKFRYLWLNVPARVRATSIEKFKSEPKKWLSAEIFASIQAHATDELTKKGVHEHTLELLSDNLGMSLGVSVDEEFDPSTIGSEEPEVHAYRVSVGMQADLRLGIRNVDEFQDFVTLSTQIHESIREACFNSMKPFDKFVICRAKRDTKLVVRRTGTFEDEKLQVHVEIGEGVVELISSEPSYLVRALKKYFPI